MNRKGPYAILLALFVLSIVVRLPNLNRPLSKHHEYCTALSLVIMEAWDKEGLSAFHYAPVQIYPEIFTQTFYKNANHPLSDEAGNLYYLSHPPLAFYVPYFVFQILSIPPSPLGLQLINLFFHGFSAVFVYWITVLLLGIRGTGHHLSGLLAAGLYLFTPATLWFQGNVFFADLFSINLFVACLYFTIKLFLDGKMNRSWNLGLFAFSLALFCYADWLGFLFAFVVFVYGLKKAFSEKFNLLVAGVCVIVVFSVASLIAWQYSQISGLPAFLETSLFRWQERGFGDANSHSLIESVFRYFRKWGKIFTHYGTGFLPVLVLLGGLILRKYFLSEKSKRATVPSIRLLVIFGLLPVLLHHALFLKYSMFHDFSVLKTAPFLAILAGWLMADWLKSPKRLVLYSSFGLTLALCLAQYYYINRPGEISWKGHRYDAMKNIGLTIKENTAPDEVVFLNGIKGPQISFYSKRNIFFAADSLSAISILKSIDAKKGRIFFVESRKVTRMEPIVVD